MQALRKSRITATRTGLAATMIASLSLYATSAWLVLDRTPPSWDDSYYLTKSLELYDTLVNKGVGDYSKKFLTAMGTKPPLIAALPTPVYLAAGRRYRAAYAVNLLFLALTFVAVYRIARIYAGPRAGLIAVTALGTMPVVYGLSHWYLVECGLIAFVCIAMYVMAAWNESSGAGRAGVLGIIFGLGVLMKASFPIYVLTPFAYFMLQWRKSALQKKPLVFFVATSALLAAPWYLVNSRGMIATALNAGSAQTAKIYATGEALSATAIGHYLFDVANATPWLYLAALPLLAVMGASSMGQTKRGLVLGLLWVAPLVFLAAGHYRDIRYAAPLYPAAALIFAWSGRCDSQFWSDREYSNLPGAFFGVVEYGSEFVRSARNAPGVGWPSAPCTPAQLCSRIRSRLVAAPGSPRRHLPRLELQPRRRAHGSSGHQLGAV